MGANPDPQPAVPPTLPALTPAEAETHYTNLLAYFRHLVSLTTGAVAVVIAIAGFLLYSNLRDVRQDARDQASRVATDEAKTAVKNAFDEKNINDLILKAAKEKVGIVTDKIIEEQLSAKLRPVEERILLIGRISECEARIHTGFRSALVELNNIVNTTHDPIALDFAKSTLSSTSGGYDTYWQLNMKQAKDQGLKPLDFLMTLLPNAARSPTPTLHNAIDLINTDQNLNVVATSFLVFRESTGENVKMFDFAAVKSWCATHQSQCQ